MWKLAEPERAEEMKEKLLSMKNAVEALQDIEVGVNESKHASAYDIVFIGTFPDREALHRFENDEYHKEVGAFVSAVRLDRKVVEFEF